MEQPRHLAAQYDVRPTWLHAPLFGPLLLWCAALVAIRVSRTGTPDFLFLLWNLFLACIPLALARALRTAYGRNWPAAAQLAMFVVWLLFLPNAPYIFTDVIHLQRGSTILFWYDVMLWLSSAVTGLLLGYASLLEVQWIIARRYNALTGWMTAVAALILSGYGVYLGRVQRWNSWDVLVHPGTLLDSALQPLLNPQAHLHVYAICGAMSIALLFGYAVWHSVMQFLMTRTRRLRLSNDGSAI